MRLTGVKLEENCKHYSIIAWPFSVYGQTRWVHTETEEKLLATNNLYTHKRISFSFIEYLYELNKRAESVVGYTVNTAIGHIIEYTDN